LAHDKYNINYIIWKFSTLYLCYSLLGDLGVVAVLQGDPPDREAYRGL
jgi:hypothetical protein